MFKFCTTKSSTAKNKLVIGGKIHKRQYGTINHLARFLRDYDIITWKSYSWKSRKSRGSIYL